MAIDDLGDNSFPKPPNRQPQAIDPPVIKRPRGRPKKTIKESSPGKERIKVSKKSKLNHHKAKTRIKFPSQVRSKWPWKLALEYFVTPILDSQQNPRWPRIVDVAEKFGIPEGTLRQHCAKNGWIVQQRDAEDFFWRDRNDHILRTMAHRIPQVQGAAFTVAAKAIQQLQAKTNEPLDVASLHRAVVANERALGTAFTAAGLKSPNAAYDPVFPTVTSLALQQLQQQQTVVGTDGKPQAISQKTTLLSLFQSRILGS
jgi:hypothetical protein